MGVGGRGYGLSEELMGVGGGPLGHPKVYINVDKPEIIPCEYCGLPFVSSMG